MRKLFWMIALSLVAGGCGKPPVFHVTVEGNLCCGAEAYKVIVDGREAGPFGPDEKYEFEAPATARSGEPQAMMPPIRAQLLYVCGWQEAKVILFPPTRDAIENATGPVHARAALDFRPVFAEVNVWVDNRGGGDAVLSVGESKRYIAAGSTRSVSFPYSAQCEEAKLLRLNGETIANIPSGHGHDAPGYLVDTSGARCYSFQSKHYANMETGQGQPVPTLVSAAKAHLLDGRIDYFLQEAPSSIIVRSDEGAGTTRLSVVEGKCR